MKDVKFIVSVDYKTFGFENIEEATLFAVTAKKTCKKDIKVSIELELVDTTVYTTEEEV